MTNNIYDDVKLKFEKFLTLMANVLIGEKEILTIQNKLRRHFNTTVSDYLCSKEFQLSLESIEKIFHEQKKSKYYSLIASLDEQLKKHSIKSIKPTETHSPRPTTTTASVSTIEYDVSISDVQETIESLLDQCCQMFSDQPKTSMTKTRREEKIFRLEKRLARLSKIIRELEEKDMSLDEMAHCDLYEVEANLKRQACFVYEKIAKLQSQSVNTERILQKRIQLNDTESDYPLITKDLEQMINRSTDLPAFADVLNVVEQANKKYHLNLTEEIQRKFAEKSLKLIGKEFKTRRMADFQDIMLSRLPEDFNVEQNDPALENAEIEQVLIANERDAVIKTEQIFEEFSQIEPDPENEVNTETAGEESPEEQEEEEPVIIVEVQEIEQDAIDILSPLSVQPRTPIAADSDSPEVQSEISLTDRSVTILSTASLPPPPPSVQTLTPRRKPIFHDNELIYKLYKQCLTDNSSTKRSVPEDTSVRKKVKQPDLIILD